MIYIYIYLCISTCIHVHMYIYIYIHIDTHVAGSLVFFSSTPLSSKEGIFFFGPEDLGGKELGQPGFGCDPHRDKNLQRLGLGWGMLGLGL